jgi:hypothetical protein
MYRKKKRITTRERLERQSDGSVPLSIVAIRSPREQPQELDNGWAEGWKS